MKTSKNLIALFILLLIASSCHHWGNRMVIDNGKDRIEVQSSGEIAFNDDETAIESISGHGYVRFLKNEKKFLAGYKKNGEFKYELYNDGKKLDSDSPEGKKFITEMVRSMISTGFGAKEHIKRLVQKGGIKAVLAEVDKIETDFGKSVYLEYLIPCDSLTAQQLLEITGKIAKQINSDFEKSKLLQKYNAGQLKDSLTSFVYFAAAKSIGSDFEKANVLKAIVKQPISDKQTGEIVALSKTVESDFERANVLKEIIHQNKLSEPVLNPFLNSAELIKSDFEKANVLKELIHVNKIDSKSIVPFLNSTGTINSDFEKANVLKEIIHQNKLDEANLSLFLNTTGTINSDFERKNILDELIDKQVFQGENFKNMLTSVHQIQTEFDRANLIKKIAGKAINGDDSWIGLIDEAAQITADFEKCNTLLEIAGKMPKTEEIKASYMKAAKTINAENEFGRAVKAIN
ncbi:MAG TPA: hypothetical protein PKO30_01060 [Prolixibacteraceae bacterium]|nr:hypothetical protein [Prolixibacteraceae bacterium]